jgi:hypothetical protein
MAAQKKVVKGPLKRSHAETLKCSKNDKIKWTSFSQSNQSCKRAENLKRISFQRKVCFDFYFDFR